jgi:hypothetical protein
MIGMTKRECRMPNESRTLQAERRNKHAIQNWNVRNARHRGVLDFEFQSFGFVSNLDIRISDFAFLWPESFNALTL